MAAPKPDAMTTASPEESISSGVVSSSSAYLLRRQIFRPCALGLIGLAISVFLCGFSCKLSLYHPHPAPSSQSQTVKLWFEPRHGSFDSAPRTTAKADLVRDSYAAPAAIRGIERADNAVVGDSGNFLRKTALFVLPIPARSPPIHLFR